MDFAPRDLQRALLTWYDMARRSLPWRARPGDRAEPYGVWLSEVMLQQTTVKAVIPYFEAFLAQWPTVEDLGAAPRDEILAAWAGLGYYSRARNLHACAQIVARDGFPQTEQGLRKLPGIGAYTAAAIAAIAFDEAAAVVDGNVERVLARLFALDTPLPAAKPAIRALAADLTPSKRPGDYAQAMMDLGATVCTPRNPSCPACPVRGFCAAAAGGDPTRFPLKGAKAGRPIRRGDAFVIVRRHGRGPEVMLRRRPDKGLLGGMMEVPCTEWVADQPAGKAEGSDRKTPSFCPSSPVRAKNRLSGNQQPKIGTGSPPLPQPSPQGEREQQRPLSLWGGRQSRRVLGQESGPPDVLASEAPNGWIEAKTVSHTFTHFHLEMRVFAAGGNLAADAPDALGGEWAALAELRKFALPAVMKKAVDAGLEALGIDYSGNEASSPSKVSTVERSARPSVRAWRK